MQRLMFLIGIVLMLQLTTCTKEHNNSQNKPQKQTVENNTNKLAITVTTQTIAYAAKKIGGDNVNITTLISYYKDPHNYEAQQQDIGALANANLVLYNGLGLEATLNTVLKNVSKHTKIVAIGEALPKGLLIPMGNNEEAVDPHIWMDVSLWMRVVENIRDNMISLAPNHKPEFEKNCDKLINELKALHIEISALMATLPKDSRTLITTNDAFRYFGRAYGLSIQELSKMDEQKKPSDPAISYAADLIIAKKAKTVFFSGPVLQVNINSIIDSCKTKGYNFAEGERLYGDTMSAPGSQNGADTYPGMMRYIAKTIFKGLGD